MHTKKTLTLGLGFTAVTILLSACGGPSTPEPDLNAANEICTLPARPAGEQPGVLCGQLSGVNATQVKPTKEEVENPKVDLIASVSNNQFNQQLPSVAAVDSEYVPANDPIAFNDLFVCNAPVTAAPADLKIIPINLLQTNTGQQIHVQQDNGTSTTFKFWWYASKTQSVTVSGSECYTFGSFTNQTFDLKLGWNLVTFTLNDDLKNSTFQVGAPDTTRYTWTASSAANALSPQGSRDPYFLMPWMHLDNYKNRH